MTYALVHDGTITRTDRIALSNALYALAERFTDHARRWRPETGVPRDLLRQARTLAQLGRAVISPTYEYARAEAFYSAGESILRDEEAAWQFFRTVSTPPSRSR